MKKKPLLSFRQIWNMSFGFLGIQFGFALQNANVSRIFETLDAPIDKIPILWLAAPVTGLIIQPIVGHYSDQTWNRFGRRRPYFLIGALLASLALVAMPNAPVLWIAAGMLWIMDASINISMEPFRAFVGDMLSDQQRTKGFAMQTFFIGVGAVAGSALPWIMTNWMGIQNTAPQGIIPPSVRWSFYIGAVVFFLSVLITVLSTREYSPQELREFEQAREQEEETPPKTKEAEATPKTFFKTGTVFGLAGLIIVLLTLYYQLEKELYVLGGILLLFFTLTLIAGLMGQKGKTHNGLYHIFNDMMLMPATMRQLSVVQFFSWFALFSMWIYTTSSVTETYYHTIDPRSTAYNNGADWVNILFAVYNGIAALVSFILPPLARRIGRRMTHGISLVLGGLGLVSILLFKDPIWLILPMVGIGIAWASILSMPYAILTGALPANKMGIYMGIFNYFIVLPQIVAATILGFMVHHLFHDRAIYALVVGGLSMALAALSLVFVNDLTEKRIKR